MRNHTRSIVTALVLISLINTLLLFVHRVMTNGDNLDYLLIAGSVMGGNWTEPFHWRFPVGYPFLVAAFAMVAGLLIQPDPLALTAAAVYAIKLLGVAAAPVAVLLVWQWGRIVLKNERWAFLLAVLFATNQHVAPLYSIIGAEPFFILCSWGAMYFWERLVSGRADREARVAFAAVVLTMLAILFRQIGMAIPVAVIAWAVLSGEWRRRSEARKCLVLGGLLLAAGIAMMLMSNPDHLGQLAAGQGDDHSDQGLAATKVELLTSNLIVYQKTIPDLLLPKIVGSSGLLSKVGLSSVEWPWIVLVYILFFAGLFSSVKMSESGTLSVMYLAVSLLVILVWPHRDVRFLTPLIPVLWLLTIRGGVMMAEKLFRQRPLVPRLGLVVLLLIIAWQFSVNTFAGIKNVGAMRALSGLPPWRPERYEITGETDFSDHLACGLWIGEHASDGSLIYAAKPSFIALSSGQRTLYMHELLHALDAKQALPEQRDHYVVVDIFPESAGYGRSKLTFLEHIKGISSPTYDLVYQARHGARVYQCTGASDK